MHGRSSFVESFVWFLPFLCALGKRRDKREEKRGRRKEKRGKEKEKRGKRKEEREKEKEKKRKREKQIEKTHKTLENHRTNCHIMIRKKKNRRAELFGIFSSKVQTLTLFSINSMIRIRFSGFPGMNLESIFGRTEHFQTRHAHGVLGNRACTDRSPSFFFPPRRFASARLRTVVTRERRRVQSADGWRRLPKRDARTGDTF